MVESLGVRGGGSREGGERTSRQSQHCVRTLLVTELDRIPAGGLEIESLHFDAASVQGDVSAVCPLNLNPPHSTTPTLWGRTLVTMTVYPSSAECIESIYRSTTFVFTDAMSYQLFAGLCKLPPSMQEVPAQPPPAFFKHACQLEISLNANFATSIPCTDEKHAVTGPVHDVFDFHWLQLNRFDHLTDLKIWVTSRAAVFWTNPDNPPARTPLLVDLSGEALRKGLQTVRGVQSVALSGPLHQDVDTADGSEDGLVEGVAPKNVYLWKRGTGDRYHPYLGPINPGGIGDGFLTVSPQRYAPRD